MTPSAYGELAFWIVYIPLFFIFYRMMLRGDFLLWMIYVMSSLFAADKFGEIAKYAAKYFATRYL